MNFSKVRPCLLYILRYWLVIAAILFVGLAIAAKPTVWAASVFTPNNQTVPPFDAKHYLPLIKKFD